MSIRTTEWERELCRDYAAWMAELGFQGTVLKDCGQVIQTSLDLMEHYNKVAMNIRKPKRVNALAS